ncbi:MAG: Spy/CpxP family protein refolding chaperone [Nitrospiraceae bacterium]
MKRTVLHGVLAAALMTGLGISGAWANYGYDHKDGERGEHGGGHKMGMMHGGTGHFITHLLKHEKEIGLSPEQVTKLKGLQSELDKTRTKAEEDMGKAEKDVREMVKDEKADMAAIESKLKQSTDLQLALRLAAIKTRRDALAVLTPEQRAKEKEEHDKAMKEHREQGGDDKDGHHGKGYGKGDGHGDPHKSAH